AHAQTRQATARLVRPEPLRAVHQAWADEKGRRNGEPVQKGVRDLDVAAQTVVEGERDLVAEHAAVRRGVGDRAQRHDVEAALEPAQLALERRAFAARRAVEQEDAGDRSL